MNLLTDPLFRLPFFTGLAFAVLLPLLGMYLRLRGEWLAALAFAQLASAGTLLATLFGIPPQLGGMAAAFMGAGLKNGVRVGASDSAYALMLLAGWGLGVLVVANVPVAEQLGHALFDGQLYFTQFSHLTSALAYLLIGGLVLTRLNRPLLLARYFPDFLGAQGKAEWRYHLGFDLLIAGALALATASIGVMAAFAFVFAPPLIAWRLAAGWKKGMVVAVTIGAGCHLLAFGLAMVLDQPYGPVAAVVLVLAGILGSLVRK